MHSSFRSEIRQRIRLGAIYDGMQSHCWRSRRMNSQLRIDLVNGSMIRLYGADNPDALRGPYLDGVVLDEFADMKPEVWYEVVRPMLADRHGWGTFIGTPKGKNEVPRLTENAKKDPQWFHMILKASESGIIQPTELADLRKEMSEDQYNQEFECSFEAAIRGAFYAEEMRVMLAEGRIAPIEINGDVRVHTAWDLGVSDLRPSGLFRRSTESGAWSITTNSAASDWNITPKSCTTSASSTAGSTETTTFLTT